MLSDTLLSHLDKSRDLYGHSCDLTTSPLDRLDFHFSDLHLRTSGSVVFMKLHTSTRLDPLRVRSSDPYSDSPLLPLMDRVCDLLCHHRGGSYN